MKNEKEVYHVNIEETESSFVIEFPEFSIILNNENLDEIAKTLKNFADLDSSVEKQDDDKEL